VRIALINTNRIRPPIAPIGLEYLAETLAHEGYEPQLLDLCWEDDWKAGMARFFGEREYDVVGFSLRNTDDCAYTSRHSFMPEFLDMIRFARGLSGGLLVVGGVGFSTLPGAVLEACGADAGVHGQGEEAMLALLRCLERGRSWRNMPGILLPDRPKDYRPPRPTAGRAELPAMSRRWLDNARYFREGGQAGIETKRGCPWRCTYCCEPLAKGTSVQARDPGKVAEELGALLEQSIDHIHTCDSEFNLPPEHGLEVCREIASRGLGDRLRWYAYCTPVPFSRELARSMREAGCVGINFGADSGDPDMLGRLGRGYGPEQILDTVRYCRDEGITVMLDLLFGAPGESAESIERTIELVKRSGAACFGISTGVRVWPGTPIARTVRHGALGEGLVGEKNPLDPVFFIEPSLGEGIFDHIDRRIGGDERFFFFNPNNADQNYNYNGNEVLMQAIECGYRGAYWDILRRLASLPERSGRAERQ
jgi:radical SAM superfamily enzyme YgiQ (UPF0313 family)